MNRVSLLTAIGRRGVCSTTLIILLIAAAAVTGCSKKAAKSAGTAPSSQVDNSPTTLSAGNSAEAAHAPHPATVPPNHQLQVVPPDANLDATLSRLTTELRRYVGYTRMPPKSFEEFVAHDPVTFPPPPAGKKYVIAQGKVVLQ